MPLGVFEMNEKNLDIYGHKTIPWSRARTQLEQLRDEGRGRTCWLATADPDGRPHIAAVGAIWLDDRFYFTSGPRTRKSRNLAANPKCAISVSLGDIDVVVEGTARKVTDMPTLERVAGVVCLPGLACPSESRSDHRRIQRTKCRPAPWDLYAVMPSAAVGVATAEPHGATRWSFDN